MPTKKGGFAYCAALTRDFLLDLLFPVECLGCGKPDEWLCPKCFRALPVNNRSACPGCGRGSDHFAYCRQCAPDHFLSGIWTASDYRDPVIADMIKKYKYHFAKNLSAILGRLLAIYFIQLLESYRRHLAPGQDLGKDLAKQLSMPLPILWPDYTAVIPVPLHEKRRRWRGFNQAELIAADFCGYFNFDFKPGLLARTRNTAPQMKLKKEKRLKNLTNAFECRENNLGRRPVILIDDVATSGATLNECARTLKGSGASEVWGLVIAHG